MSDDAERKAKAERAKKLLAQRRKDKEKNKSGVSTPTVPASPSVGSEAISAADVPSTRTSLSAERDADVKPDATSAAADDVGPSSAVAAPAAPTSPTPAAADRSRSESLDNLQQTVSLMLTERTELQTQIAALQQQLASARADTQLLAEGRSLISRLEEENGALEKRLADAETEAKKVGVTKSLMDKLREEMDGVKQDHARLEEEKRAWETREQELAEASSSRAGESEKALSRAREREGVLEAEVGRLRQGHAETTASLDTVSKELDALRESSSEASSSLAAMQATHSALQKAHEDLTSEHAALGAAHSSVQTELATVRDERETAATSLEASTSRVAALEAEVDKLKMSLAQATKRAEAAEKKRDALQSENGELVQQLEEVRGRVVQVMEEKVEAVATVQSWEAQGKAWDKQRAELEGKVEQAQTRLDTLAAENEQLKAVKEAHDNLQLEMAEKQGERDGLARDLDRSKGDLEATRITIAEQEASLKVTRADLETTRASADTLEATVSRLQSELDGSRTTVRERDDAVSALQAQLDNARSQITAQESAVVRLQDEVAQAQTLAAERDETIAALRPELAAAQATLASYESTTASLRSELDAFASKDHDSVIDALRTELESARAAAAERDGTVADMRAALDAADTLAETNARNLGSLQAEVDSGKGLQDAVHALEGIIAADEGTIRNLESTIADLRDEVRGLQAAAAAAPPPAAAPSSEDAVGPDMRAHLLAAHALEVSDLTARIRSLETSLHASTSHTHELTRELADALAAGSAYGSQAGHSPKRGLFLSPADEYLPSLGSPRPPLPRAVDAGLPAAMRHKRQVSLSALKARMGIETPRVPKAINALDAVGENGEGETAAASPKQAAARRQRQFGDEIMHCCAACEGDFITL